MREVERQVMLRIIDQRWREHLDEMDYLQEGINLRAMGQKDPLVEWQREGFEMFGAMMKGIAQDFVRYVMHVQVVQQDQAPAPGACTNVADARPRPTTDDDLRGVATACGRGAAPRRPATEEADAGRRRPRGGGRSAGEPHQAADGGEGRVVARRRATRRARAASGKKFKLCHGAAERHARGRRHA